MNIIKFRKITAIFQIQLKDIRKNTQTLLLFFIYPLVAFILVSVMPKEDANQIDFIAIFCTMHVTFTPLVTIASIIGEQKEKRLLRELMMSNIHPSEYLMGIGGFVFVSTVVTGCSFIFMNPLSSKEIFYFIISLIIGTICSILLGATIGAASPNQTSAVSMAVPAGLLFGFLPMLSSFNQNIQKAAQLTYSQRIKELLTMPSEKGFTWYMLTTIGINFLIFLTTFLLIYRKKRLDD